MSLHKSDGYSGPLGAPANLPNVIRIQDHLGYDFAEELFSPDIPPTPEHTEELNEWKRKNDIVGNQYLAELSRRARINQLLGISGTRLELWKSSADSNVISIVDRLNDDTH